MSEMPSVPSSNIIKKTPSYGMDFLQKAIQAKQSISLSTSNPRQELINYLKEPLKTHKELSDIVYWWGVSQLINFFVKIIKSLF
jgi:hypothetical protein